MTNNPAAAAPCKMNTFNTGRFFDLTGTTILAAADNRFYFQKDGIAALAQLDQNCLQKIWSGSH